MPPYQRHRTSGVRVSRTSRSVPTLALAALLAGFALTGCADSKSGAAAVVGGDRIEISSLNASVEQVADAREKFGIQQVSGVEDSRAQLARMIEERVTAVAAKRAGITVTGTDIADRKRFLAEQNPGVSLVDMAAREGIPADEIDRILTTGLQQNKLVLAQSAKEGKQPSAEMLDRILSETAASLKITVNPRYGSAWTPGALSPTRYDWLTPKLIA
jgi:hypothetical protein